MNYLARIRDLEIAKEAKKVCIGTQPGEPRAAKEGNKAKEACEDLIGRIVSWDSPLFGLLSATVLEDLPNGVRVFHPLTEMTCVIPSTWLRL